MRNSAWWAVGLLLATSTAGYLCRVNLSVSGALLMEEFHLSQVEMGRLFSAFLVGYAIFQVPGGMAADRFGTRRVLTAAAWWWVLVTVSQAIVGAGPLRMGATGALAALAALRFAMGVGASPTYPASAHGVARWIPPAFQARANGLVIASVGLGSALAPPLLSMVMIRWGWRASLVASALPALLVAVAWHFVREPSRQAEAGPGTGALRAATAPASVPSSQVSPPSAPTLPLASRSLVLLTISYGLQGYVGYIFVFWFYLYLVQVRHFDLMRGAVMSALPWVLSIVSIPLGGLVSDRLAQGRLGTAWGRRAVALVGLAGSGVFISLGAETASAYLAAVYLALATSLVLSVEGPFWATAAAVAGPRSGTASGIMNTGCNIGGLLSPALTPALAAVVGWANALHVAAALAVAGGLMWFWIAPQAAPAAPPDPGT